MAKRCPDCGRAFGTSRPPVQTAAGRHVCTDCRDNPNAAVTTQERLREQMSRPTPGRSTTFIDRRDDIER